MKKIGIILINLIAAYPLFAQVPPPGGVPIDPVSWVLLGAAGVIGAKKYRDSRKKD